MNTRRNFTLLLLFIFSVNIYSEEINDIEIIKKNFHRIYIDEKSDDFGLMEILNVKQPGYDVGDRVIVELQQRVPYSFDRIESYLDLLKENGEWSDINYQNKNRSGWEPRLHSERILELVIAYLNEKSKHYQKSNVNEAVHRSMKFWFDSKLISSNWWYNQIGPQRTLGTAFILFENYMSDKEISNAREVLMSSKFGMTGQNKVWLAANVMMRGLLENDINLVKEAREQIVSEIVLGNKEGIRDDWCFHQHGSQQQFGNYGLAYVYTISLLSGILSNTFLAFTEKQLDIIASLIEKGYQWIIWKGKMDISALGRQLFVSAPIHKAIGLAFAASELGGDDRNCREIAKVFLNNCFAENNNCVGVYHFWQSDYTICRRRSWMSSLKMASKRVLGTECMNGDNMKGYYMADGAMYLYKNGNEYLDIFPLWDWRKLPGVTCYDSKDEMPVLERSYYPGNNEDFVGGLTDGKCGLSAIKLNRNGLKANKTYFWGDSIILCLGAGICSDSSLNVTTSVEQSLSKGNLKIIGKKTAHKENCYSADNIKIIHNGIGYVLWNNKGNCIVTDKRVKGSISDIMKMQKGEEVEGDVFSIYIDHGKFPKNATYCYAIMPETNYEHLSRFKASDIKVLRNDQEIQALSINDKKEIWASVLKPVKLKISDSLNVAFMTPGLYKIMPYSDKVEVICCDPTQKLTSTLISINNKKYSIILPDGKSRGTSVKQECK